MKSRLTHKVNILFPLTPHLIVVGYRDEINLSGIDPDLGHMLAWCRETYGDSLDWNHTNRIFMFATRAMASQFKLTFG